MIRFRLSLLVIFVAIFGVAKPHSFAWMGDTELERIEFAGKTMGPIDYSVVIAVEPGSVDRSLVNEAIEASLESVNQRMSTYIADSDVSRFNATRSTDWFSVDEETAKVVQRALEISRLSDGAFDMTVGPAVELWNFGKGKGKFLVPDSSAIEQIQPLIGYKNIEVQLDPPALKKLHGGARIDLSAIAKGYAVDRVAAGLKKLGVSNMIVVVGGEVYSEGVSEKGKGWRTGIEKVSELTIGVDRIVSVDGKAVATSGDYRNFSMVDGVRYAHTIDPRTCRPVANNLALAAVVADDCMTADGVATAVMVMGREKGFEFCKKNGFQLYVVERDSGDPLDSNKFQKSNTEGFPFIADARAGAGDGEGTTAVADKEAKKKSRSTGGILRVFLAAAGLFGLAILGMAIGAIFGNKPIQGSCGGLANMKNQHGEIECAVCEKPATDCKENADPAVSAE